MVGLGTRPHRLVSVFYLNVFVYCHARYFLDLETPVSTIRLYLF
jgi:hypothetical protein